MVLTSCTVLGSSSPARMAFHSCPFSLARRTWAIRWNSSRSRSGVFLQDGIQLAEGLQDLVRASSGIAVLTFTVLRNYLLRLTCRVPVVS